MNQNNVTTTVDSSPTTGMTITSTPVNTLTTTVKEEGAIKLREKSRTYVYQDGAYTVERTLTNITDLKISKSGNHRVKADGKLHIMPPGWIQLTIDETEWTI